MAKHNRREVVRDERARQLRIERAAEETRKHREALDALIARQQKEPAWGATEGARIKQEMEAAHAVQLKQIESERPIEDEVADTVDEVTVIVRKKQFSIGSLPKSCKDNLEQFAITTARMMIKDGYHAAHVVEVTGVGWDELADLPVDSDGYGCWKRLDFGAIEGA